jgi:hypothetical protein
MIMSANELTAALLWVMVGCLAGGGTAVAALIFAQNQDKTEGRCPRCRRLTPDQFGS